MTRAAITGVIFKMVSFGGGKGTLSGWHIGQHKPGQSQENWGVGSPAGRWANHFTPLQEKITGRLRNLTEGICLVVGRTRIRSQDLRLQRLPPAIFSSSAWPSGKSPAWTGGLLGPWLNCAFSVDFCESPTVFCSRSSLPVDSPPPASVTLGYTPYSFPQPHQKQPTSCTSRDLWVHRTSGLSMSRSVLMIPEPSLLASSSFSLFLEGRAWGFLFMGQHHRQGA